MKRSRVMSEACKCRGQRGNKLTRIDVISRPKWPLYRDRVRWIENKAVHTQNVCKRVRNVHARQCSWNFEAKDILLSTRFFLITLRIIYDSVCCRHTLSILYKYCLHERVILEIVTPRKPVSTEAKPRLTLVFEG